MHTLKRFIQYYRPYKTIFFLDLLCATFISIVDLLYPQFLRGAINGLFTDFLCMCSRACVNIMSAIRAI